MQSKPPIRLFVAGLLFAGLLLAHPQGARAQVYSGNVVGYVNVVITNGYYFVQNPLDAGDNSLTNILRTAPDNTSVYVWDVTNQVFLPPAVYHTAKAAWSADFDLPPGRGFVISTPSAWTCTFVGGVLEGSLTNYLAGNNKLSLVGSRVPIADQITANLGFPGIDGANVYFFNNLTAFNTNGTVGFLNNTNQDFKNASTYYAGHGWFDTNGVAVGGPTNQVAESFFAQNPGPDTNWVFHFTFLLKKQPASVKPCRMQLQHDRVQLAPLVNDGQPYDVQFSTDGSHWATVAAGQQSPTWTGAVPQTGRGYFRLVAAATNKS